MDNEFVIALIERIVKLSIGPYTFRGAPIPNIYRDVKNYLLKTFTINVITTLNQSIVDGTYPLFLEDQTEQLQEVTQRNFGLARKGLNIFIRELYYNALIIQYFNLQNTELFAVNGILSCLEIPLDKNSRQWIRTNSQGLYNQLDNLTEVPNYQIDAPLNSHYQEAATCIANNRGIAKIHFDIQALAD